ncbi:RNA-binding protein [Trypanosoma grayi]|uniref:RNA-binding protein n=1 Tax=Trypanosoma grayi TaxID=71804 RepID=UPI0004F499F1|nr:RNA-binding protein [Trypanosoma grayi]KEG06613.1 RNA-binding protein [Trypanosoma grayi]
MSFQNLFVAKLPRNLNDADLEQIFAEYKPISAKVMLDASTGKSKGFGFVLFNTEEEGSKAYKELNRKSTKACRHNFNLVIYPSQHSGKAAFSVSNALYIRNIPITVPQEQVEQFLASFGTLTYCATREDHYGNPVWVVYAEYDCLECSKNALQKLHGRNCYFNSNSSIMAKYADSEETKQERRRRREEGQLAPAPASRCACLFPLQSQFVCSWPVLPEGSASTSFAATPSVSAELPVWSNPAVSNSSPVESSKSNSFGPDTNDDGPRKSPVMVYRHNPYSLLSFGKSTPNAPKFGNPAMPSKSF